jgi:2-dehydro-3-deoxyphosphogluconate aldolase / (4S)-4-hydroxy-2-oxoglutarate aldolase
MSPKKTSQTLFDSKVLGILRHNDPESVQRAAQIALDAGLGAIEVTTSVPGWTRVIEFLKKKFSHAPVGVGTVISKELAEQAVECGADFFVSPHFDPQINFFLKDRLYIPGAFTPTEMMNCFHSGRELIKAFPAEVLGPKGVRAILQPLPMLKIMTTGGINETNVSEFFEAGVFSVGLGSELFPKKSLDKKDWPDLEKRAKHWVGLIERIE